VDQRRKNPEEHLAVLRDRDDAPAKWAARRFERLFTEATDAFEAELCRGAGVLAAWHQNELRRHVTYRAGSRRVLSSVVTQALIDVLRPVEFWDHVRAMCESGGGLWWLWANYFWLSSALGIWPWVGVKGGRTYISWSSL
jgi:hypothetical protein